MIPLFILESFNNKCSFLVNAVMEERLGRLPSMEEIRNSMTIESSEESGHTFKWKGKVMFRAQIKENEHGHIWGDWDLPDEMINNEFVKDRLNTW